MVVERRSEMDYSKYEDTKVEFPKEPQRPWMKDGATPTEIRQYAKQVEAYQKDMEVYNAEFAAAMEVYRKEKARLLELFKRDALADVGLAGHPKADRAWEFAIHLAPNDPHDCFHWLLDAAKLIL
jgi:hypothetical protein